MNRNRQVNLVKQETIGIIFNEKGRGLGAGEEKSEGDLGESIFNWDISTTLLPFPPPPHPQSLCPQNIA